MLKQGGAVEILARSMPGLDHVAVDAAHVYWASPDEGRILRAPKAGGAIEVLASGQSWPFDVAVDEQAVSWTTRGGHGTVMKVAKSPAPTAPRDAP